MRLEKKNRLRDMDDKKLLKRYSYLQSKDNTRDKRTAKYVAYHLRKRGLAF